VAFGEDIVHGNLEVFLRVQFRRRLVVEAQDVPGHDEVNQADGMGAGSTLFQPGAIALQQGHILGRPGTGGAGPRAVGWEVLVVGVIQGVIVDFLS
jgi:hypothetical protein